MELPRSHFQQHHFQHRQGRHHPRPGHDCSRVHNPGLYYGDEQHHRQCRLGQSWQRKRYRLWFERFIGELLRTGHRNTRRYCRQPDVWKCSGKFQPLHRRWLQSGGDFRVERYGVRELPGQWFGRLSPSKQQRGGWSGKHNLRCRGKRLRAFGGHGRPYTGTSAFDWRLSVGSGGGMPSPPTGLTADDPVGGQRLK